MYDALIFLETWSPRPSGAIRSAANFRCSSSSFIPRPEPADISPPSAPHDELPQTKEYDRPTRAASPSRPLARSHDRTASIQDRSPDDRACPKCISEISNVRPDESAPRALPARCSDTRTDRSCDSATKHRCYSRPAESRNRRVPPLRSEIPTPSSPKRETPHSSKRFPPRSEPPKNPEPREPADAVYVRSGEGDGPEGSRGSGFFGGSDRGGKRFELCGVSRFGDDGVGISERSGGTRRLRDSAGRE